MTPHSRAIFSTVSTATVQMQLMKRGLRRCSMREVSECGTMGDILAMRLKVRGVSGVVTDGGIRDEYARWLEAGRPPIKR